jgi:hypothetical protein
VILGLMIFRPTLPFFEYALRYDYIIEKLCENRDKPQLQCDGKCHLTKQLAIEAGDDEQKRAPSNQQLEVNFNLFCDNDSNQDFQTFEVVSKMQTPFVKSCYSFIWIDLAFEPPRS